MSAGLLLVSVPRLGFPEYLDLSRELVLDAHSGIPL